MKTAEEIIEITGLSDWKLSPNLKSAIIDSMKEYAKLVAQDALNRAAECVTTSQAGDGFVIPEEWITETEIITP